MKKHKKRIRKIANPKTGLTEHQANVLEFIERFTI